MKVGRLSVLSGNEKGEAFLLKNLSVFEAGRSQGNHILLKESGVAMSHFRICINGDEYTIYDLGSKYGTTVNGEAIEKVDLVEGDVIQVGEVELQFELVDGEAGGRLASCAPDLEDTDPELASSARESVKKVVSHGSYAYLRVIEGEEKGKTFRLIGKKQFVLGRSTKSDLRLKDGKVSRAHCVVERVGDHYIISDRESANGTIVNGEPIRKTVLKEGDYVRLGYSILKFGWWDGLGD